MTLGKIILCCSLVLALTGCSNNDDNMEIGNNGYHLCYSCRPSEELISYQNDTRKYKVDIYNIDLHLYVTSSLQENSSYPDPQRYTIKGDTGIEGQLKELLDPYKEYKGLMPVNVEYRTEPCKNIRISLYDKDNIFVSDLTEQAHFFTKSDELEKRVDVLINSSKKVLGFIKDGTTIKEYLDCNPMVFAEAYFVFDNFDRNKLLNGYYIKTEIELYNGTKLISNSLLRNANTNIHY